MDNFPFFTSGEIYTPFLELPPPQQKKNNNCGIRIDKWINIFLIKKKITLIWTIHDISNSFMKVLGSIFNDLNCGIRIDKLHEYDYNISWFIT